MAVNRRANKRPPTKKRGHVEAKGKRDDGTDKKRQMPPSAGVANICAAVGFLVYVKSVWVCEFPFDDGPAVLDNPDVLDSKGDGVMSPWVDVFQHDFWGTDITSAYTHKSYRPLVIASFRIDAMISSASWIFHLTNSILYALTCWLVVNVMISNALPRDYVAPAKNKRLAVLFSGLWFVAHPIHTEAVAGIVGRAEILAAILCIAGSKLYNSRHVWASMACFAAACLCKETAVVMPVVLAVGDVAVAVFSPKNATVSSPGKVKSAAGMIFVAVGYLSFRSWLFAGESKSSGSSLSGGLLLQDNFMLHLRPMDKLRTALYIQAKYLQLLIWPRVLSCDYSLGVIDPVRSWLSTEIAFVALAALAVLMLALVALHQLRKAGDSTLLLAIGWIFAPLVPASHIIGIGTVMAERLLFMPSIGMTMLICHLMGKRSELSPILLCIAIWFGSTTFARISDWADSSTLMSSDIITHPHSLKLNSMLSQGWWGENETTAELSFEYARTAQKVTDMHSDALIYAPYATGLPMMAFQKTRSKIWPQGANQDEALELVEKVIDIKNQANRMLSIGGDTGWSHIYAVKGFALLKKGLASQDMTIVQDAAAALRYSEKHDKSGNASYLLYCNFGVTLAILGEKEEAYEKYQECFRRKDVSTIGFGDINNYGNLMRELTGIASNNPSAARVWGERGVDAFKLVMEHPRISENDVAKWARILNSLRALIVESGRMDVTTDATPR